jgi:urea transporter
VIFLGDAAQGAAVCMALAIGDPMLSFHALGAGAWCTTLSRVMTKDDAKDGLHAYNGVLVGCASSVFMGPDPLQMVGATLVGSAAAFGVTRGLASVYPFGPQWTYAFNITAIGGLASYRRYVLQEMPSSSTHDTIVDTVVTSMTNIPTEQVLSMTGLLSTPLTGVSQIFLVNNPLSGAFLLAAIGYSSPVAMLHAAMGSTIGALVGVGIGADVTTVVDGLYGFNPCLTSLSVAIFFPNLSIGQVALSAGGAAGTAILAHSLIPILMEMLGTPAFTLPFCLAATATYGIGKAVKLS